MIFHISESKLTRRALSDNLNLPVSTRRRCKIAILADRGHVRQIRKQNLLLSAAEDIEEANPSVLSTAFPNFFQ